jgi:hypothetical protein
MKKIVFLGITLTLLVTLLGFAIQDSSKNIPAGIDPQLWIPVAENFGVALVEPSSRPLSGEVFNLRGTLMVKLGRDWHPLRLIPHFALEPAQK